MTTTTRRSVSNAPPSRAARSATAQRRQPRRVDADVLGVVALHGGGAMAYSSWTSSGTADVDALIHVNNVTVSVSSVTDGLLNVILPPRTAGSISLVNPALNQDNGKLATVHLTFATN